MGESDEESIYSESVYSTEDEEYSSGDDDIIDDGSEEEPAKRTHSAAFPERNGIFMTLNFPGDLILPSRGIKIPVIDGPPDEEPLSSMLTKKLKLERSRINSLFPQENSSACLTLGDKILLSSLPDSVKAEVLSKVEDPNLGSSDKAKVMTWGNTVLEMPLGTVKKLPVNSESTEDEVNVFLKNSRKILDETVYGMTNTKEEIIDFLAQFIKNPDSKGTILGLHGKPGLGKTKICMALSKILSLPYFHLPFGGMSDPSVLLGHDSTYVGSKPGRIAKGIKSSGCINPVICLDEIDKIGASDSDRSAGVYGVLTHLLDETQNHVFQDLYLETIPIDLSQALMVATFNEIEKIDKIVLNRIKVINVDSLMLKEKIQIAKNYVIPEYSEKFGISIDISDANIEYIISRKTKEEAGMRNIRKNIETIFKKINTMIIMKNFPDRKIITEGFSCKDVILEISTNTGKVSVGKNLIDIIFKKFEDTSEPWMNMYI
jgi:ATP-dependent Lon protease